MDRSMILQINEMLEKHFSFYVVARTNTRIKEVIEALYLESGQSNTHIKGRMEREIEAKGYSVIHFYGNSGYSFIPLSRINRSIGEVIEDYNYARTSGI